jgi:hypothetical protein
LPPTRLSGCYHTICSLILQIAKDTKMAGIKEISVVEIPSSLMLSIILTVLSIVVVALVPWTWRLALPSGSTGQTTSQASPKLVREIKCRRIRDIPIDKTEQDLRHQLERSLRDSATQESHSREEANLRLTLARSSCRHCMATVTTYEALEHFIYPVDVKFDGVTPLFDSDEAVVE